jgi:hypothetical protein
MPSRDELIAILWDLVKQPYRMERPKSKADAPSIALNLISADLKP